LKVAFVGILVVLSMSKSLSSGLGWAIVICLKGDLNVVFSQARIPSSHTIREPHVLHYLTLGMKVLCYKDHAHY
jgi:hypothetical protein